MGEQRFKVGDWVRRVEPSDWSEQYGVVDGIYKVLKVGRYGIAVTVGAGEADATSFEPWQPRVGERVRVVRAELSHKAGRIGLEFNVTHEAYKVCNGVQTWGGDDAGGYVWRADELEPILTTTPEQPATLKIEAGKFYKTRDGRKLGPIVVAQGRGEPWPWKSCYGWNTYYFKEDGFSCPGSIHNHRDADDLIAEWIDEPVTKASNDNAQPKFKVGDRVKIVSNSRESYLDKRIGSFFTIITKDGPNNTGWSGSSEENPYWWPAQDLELANITPSTPTTTIVALIEDGQPKPSSTPHVHASTGAAEAEAKRLAAKYKGKQFGVFTLTTTHEEAAPVYGHKWQNLAVLGLKIDAIKELRAVAGLDLLSAKHAVEVFIDKAA